MLNFVVRQVTDGLNVVRL